MKNVHTQKKKIELYKLLILLGIICCILAILIIGICLSNAKISLFAKNANQMKANYTSTGSNTWDVSQKGDRSVLATLLDDGVLIVSGTGDMKEWKNTSNIPWHNIRSQIKSVKIGEGVTCISDFAFMNCSNMTNIIIPESVIAIGKQSLYGCNSLINITIPEGVTRIGSYAFAKCTSLENVVIPETVENIGSRIFENCIRLKNVQLPKDATFNGYIFFNSVMQLFINESSQTEQEIEMIEIIKRAKIQGDILYTENDFVFENCRMNEDNTKLIINMDNLKKGNETSIKINGGVLNNLTLIVMLPEMTWDISKNKNSSVQAVFNYNSKVLKISGFGDGQMKDFGWDFGPWYYLREYIESVVIEEGVTRIGNYCFFDNPGVNDIKLPTTLKLIAPYAFRGCDNLEKIDIPEGTVTIGTGAFSNCDNLQEFNISSTVYAIGIDNVTIHWDEGMLEGLTLTTTGEVFKECKSLQNINVDSNNKYYSSDEGVLFNKTKSSLIIYPPAREQQVYEIPTSVRKIEDDAFDSCINLQTIDIPGTVEEIGKQCFMGSDISKVILNEGLKRISENAFYENEKIKEIYIPSSVENIGEGAFSKMNSLNDIKVSTNNKNYSSEAGVLFNKEKTQILQYPGNKLQRLYIVPNTVEIIETGAFGYSNNLQYLKLNDKVKEIGTSAFAFSKLLGIYIPNSVDIIGVFDIAGVITPFYGCKDYTIYCNDDSYAKEFCINYNLNYSTDITEIQEKIRLNTLNTILVTTPPITTIYQKGQNFDNTGMIVTATYNDGSTNEVMDYTIMDGSSLPVGKTNITISYTENGVTKTTTQDITVIEEEKLEIDLGIYEEKQDETTKYITNISQETTIEELLKNIDTNGNIEIYIGTEKITDTDTAIGTGMTVKITLNNEDIEYTIIVKGDINGDGKVKLSDLSKLKLSVIGTTQLEGAYKDAADLNGDGKVKLSDLSKMKLYLVGKGSL